MMAARSMLSFFRSLTLVLFFSGVTLALSPPVHATESCTSFSANGINNWYPFSYRTDKGELTGIVVDGMREALSRIGLTMEVETDRPWKRILYDLEMGNLDIVLGAYWNSERALKYHYSEKIGTDDLNVFVKTGNEFPLSNPEDLIGRTGLRLLGGSLGDDFDHFAKVHLNFVQVPQSDNMITMLVNDRADYAVLGYVEGLQHIRDLGLKGQVSVLPEPILSNAMYALINREANCAKRLRDLNEALRAMQKEGVIEQIITRHMGLITSRTE
ncbi:substrate-binding periplasmic protein [Kiloniella laminariae]|uniref:substrate-binding periplasmic protein n=1 Tax=Kiloniella laminariae TaxID=454162 RepID=UPI00039EE2D5|nr:transporter substrate-binding domain-containing protein [Kiloniella laminariae]